MLTRLAPQGLNVAWAQLNLAMRQIFLSPPLHPLPSEIAPCDKVDATDPTAFSTPLGEIHVGAWSILFLLGCECHSGPILTLSQKSVVCACVCVCDHSAMFGVVRVCANERVCVCACAPARVRFIWVQGMHVITLLARITSANFLLII